MRSDSGANRSNFVVSFFFFFKTKIKDTVDNNYVASLFTSLRFYVLSKCFSDAISTSYTQV